MDERSHLLARAAAVLVALTVGTIHLVAYWGTFAMVIDLLWMPPVVAMAGLLVREAMHKPRAMKVSHS